MADRTAPTQGPPVTFRGLEVERQLAARQRDEEKPGLVAKRDLERYYEMLDAELARLRLTEPEASLIVDAINGVWLGDGAWRYIRTEVEDACRLNDLGAKHGLGEQQQAALIERMRDWTPGTLLAVTDGAERFWRDQEATVQSVGLVR